MRNLQLQTLGYVAKTKRSIKNSDAYSQLFGAASGVVINVKSNASLDDITTTMQQLVSQTLPQTQKFANWLKSKSTNTENLLQNLFNFIYTHFDYKEDMQGYEQLREPARLFKDKIGDCDCYSVFIKSVLTNLGIQSHFKIVALNNNPNFQHVYVIVPKQKGASLSVRNNYWVIDPVLDKFDLEAPAITKQQIKGLSGVQLQTLGATTFVVDKSKLLPPVLDNKNIIPQGGFLTASTIKFGEDYNPFEQVIEQTFKGSRIENLAKTKLAPRNKAINGLNGASVLDNLNPLDPKNLDNVLNAPEVKDYANTLKGSVKLLSRPEAQAAIKKLADLNKVISENKIDAKASDIVLSPKPIKEFANSSAGLALLGTVGATLTAIGTSAAIAGIGVLLGSNPVGWVATGIGVAVGVVVTAFLFLFTDNADETLGNFFDWVKGKGPTIIPWDNYEGFNDSKTDINTYGRLIRGWRLSATGSESGSDSMQIPADYFPILLSIFQNAPLPTGGTFIVNPNKLAVYAQFNSAMTTAYNSEYWKQPSWMKFRAFMVTPLLAEILYRETYDSYKIKMQVFFQSKNVQVNWALIDAEYLTELQNTLFLELLIAKRNQIAYDNSNNLNNNTINPTDPAVNGAIVWIGGQYNGTRSGFQTNQPNLGLKAGDKVFIQITSGAGTAYNGIRTIHSLGTDDGLYKQNMFVLDMPMVAGAQQSTGVFTFQAPFESGDASGGGGLFKVGALALGIKLLSALV